MTAFLGTPKPVETGRADTVLLRARYDIAHFHPDLYAHYAIAPPDKLSNAVLKRQADFLAGRALLNRAFETLNLPPQPIPIGENRAPDWPVGLSGSISHTRDTCACILSTDTTLHVGIDVERTLSKNSEKAVRKLTLTETERQMINAHPDERHLAGLVFSAKETLFKALYPTVQSFFGFECAEMRALPQQSQLQLALTKTLHPSLPIGAVFDVQYLRQPDHVLTWLLAQN